MVHCSYAGIDVALESLVVVTLDEHLVPSAAQSFANSKAGHKKLVRHLLKSGLPTQVCLEPTSNYHYALAQALHDTDGVTVSVVNPRCVRNFAKSRMQRAKTDACDALMLAWFGEAVKPVAWIPPRQVELELRSISRRLEDLTKRGTALKCRKHSSGYGCTSRVVKLDLEAELKSIKRRLHKLRQAALELIGSDDLLARQLVLLQSVKGIAEVSGIKLLAELCVLPEGLTKRQWVAAAGLDPVPKESGKSLKGKRRISKQGNKHLRTALNCPALVASQWCPEVKAYYEMLQGRGLAKLSALCAIMRKLLQALWGMFNSNMMFNPKLFFQIIP